MPVNIKIRLILLSFIVFISAVFFTTCDSPLGMGLPIDFEPPVLTLDPKPPTPFYVGLGAQLTGTATDNVAVDRVILRDSISGAQIFTATLLPNNRWEINLEFSSEQNGQTILADVVAFDKMGNSGAESIASVVLIIDIRPPIVEDIWIRRSSTKTTDVEPYLVLKELETTDPNGELSKNVNRYQNGAFYVEAKISEKESRIKSVLLKLYDDNENPDIELVSLEPESGSSIYSPKWLLTEDMILDAGADKLPVADYKSNYKVKNERYYYRLRIVAIDYSDNESGNEASDRVEDKGYLCLWNEADYPKGYLDPLVVGAGDDITVVKGSTLPAEFFDDDKIDWAYDALFTQEQWIGLKDIAPSGVKIDGADDDERFKYLENKLRAGDPVYNWNFDRHNDLFGDLTADIAKREKIVNLVPTDGADEKTHLSLTGKGDTDYGDYVFVTLVKDKKLSPHKGDEYPAVTKYRKYNVTIVDENAPLIVFDKTTDRLPVGTPEENTFPALTADGKFTIHGYTLREDKSLADNLGTGGVNKVEKFRIAWVPYTIASAPGSNAETLVKEALKKTSPQDSDFPTGVQWWELDSQVSGSIVREQIGESVFRKQYFSKVFSILGEPDDKKPTQYDNFTRTKGNKNTFENATKLFIFYAEDNMGHPVTRQFYLLGNKTLPTIDVYDITDRLTMNTDPPNVYDFDNEGMITSAYITARDAYNNGAYSQLKLSAGYFTENDKTDNYRAYPRGTIIKLWANAKANGALGIANIKMQDITYEGAPVPIGSYNPDNQDLGYVEYFPEVTQRVFLFTAIDKLGNEAKAQRTIAIANAAALTSITTPKQNGLYPKDNIIELRANFDGMVRLESNANGTRPKLNVLYKIGLGAESSLVYGVQQIECEPVTDSNGTLYLTFNFKIPENAKGKLLTIYKGISEKPTSNPAGFPSFTTAAFAAIDRPITLTPGNNIIDAVRGDSAYTPGNVSGFYWDKIANSLQEKKDIRLDGEPPRINTISIDTKIPYETGKWYLKSGESISFLITASEPLKVKGDSTTALRFRLQRPDNEYTGYNNTAFDYRKLSGSTVTFTLDVNRSSIPYDGILQNDITLFNSVNITDDAGNPVVVDTFTTALNTFTAGKTIYFDLTPPVRPITNLTGATTTIEVGTTALSGQTIYYSVAPKMGITNSYASDEPYDTAKRQYSLNGGLNWVDFPSTEPSWTSVTDNYYLLYILNGQWSLKTRFIDKAGNEGATTNQLIYVNTVFPKLLGVTVVEPNATYNSGTLHFQLDFDDKVTAEAGSLSNITISLKDKSTSDDTLGGLTPTYKTGSIQAAQVAGERTLTFTWTLNSNTRKDMLNGLALDSINISGLKDRFGNTGPTDIAVTNSGVTVTYSNPNSPPATLSYIVSYDLTGVKVSTIKPSVRSREPQNAQGRTGNITVFEADPEIPAPASTIAKGSISSDNKTIKLNFSKPMQKGNGTITIRPHGNYAIPAVFESEGYYIAYTYDANGNISTETVSSTAGAGKTYVTGFSEIFNSSNINNTDRNTLITGTSMSSPDLSEVTGLSQGPYLRTTHGLKKGAGYKGYYGNANSPTDDMPGKNAPGPRGANFMVPDVETKWVLHNDYSDLFSASGTVSNIRAVLDKAKWRWKEIAVTSSDVVIDGDKKTVTINLSEPLLPGLQWDLYYTEDTFTDEAGNKADGVIRSSYWFWSNGVQKPVIRVNRKSYDAREEKNYNKSSYNNNFYYKADGYNGAVDAFNKIAYTITSETPQARVFHGTLLGKDVTGVNGVGSIIGLWTSGTNGSVPVANNSLNIVADSTIKWQGPKNGATTQVGIWVRPNLIYRHYAIGGTYDTMLQPPVSQTVGGGDSNGLEGSAGGGRFYGFRSYNKDATESDLNGIDITTEIPAAGAVSSLFSFAPDNITTASNYRNLEASKNYVAAISGIDHVHTNGTYIATNAISSKRGFEGVFRTVVMMNQSAITGSDGSYTNITTTSHPLMISGSNVRNGTPTIAGFPIKDGTHRTDSRYVKFFYRGTNGASNASIGYAETSAIPPNPTNSFYWVTTEIVSSWYFQIIGRGNGGSTSSTMGDVEDWMSGGYGDLSYALNLN